MNIKTFSRKDKIVIYIEGQFTFTDYSFLEETIALFEQCNADENLEFFQKGEGHYKREIVLDFSRCIFMDTCAIGMLAILNDEADKNFIYLILKPGKGFCKKLFEKINFKDFCEILV